MGPCDPVFKSSNIYLIDLNEIIKLMVIIHIDKTFRVNKSIRSIISATL